MSSCECKMQNIWKIKNKCKVCKRTVCDTCSVDWLMSSPKLCRTCDLVGRTKFEHKELMLLTDEQLIDVVSFFDITLKSSTIIKVDMVNLILNVCNRRPRKLQNLMTFRRTEEPSPNALTTKSYEFNEEKQDQVFYEDNNQRDFEGALPPTCDDHNSNIDLITFPEELTVDMIPYLNMHELQQHIRRLNINYRHCLKREDYVDALSNHLTNPPHQLREKSTTLAIRNIRTSSSGASTQHNGGNLQATKFLSLQDISSIDVIPSLSIKQLQYILQRRSVDCQNLSDKSQLAYRVSQIFHRMHENKPSDSRKLRRKTSKRDAFYLEYSDVATLANESEASVHCVPVPDGNVITLEQIKSPNDIEDLSCEQLNLILTQNSIPCNDVAHHKWELAFKVLQLWYNYQATREADLKCCVICMENEIDCTILECGHTIACTNCASNLNKCPMCIKPISRLVKIFKP